MFLYSLSLEEILELVLAPIFCDYHGHHPIADNTNIFSQQYSLLKIRPISPLRPTLAFLAESTRQFPYPF
jgi:hypothetical protein